MTNGSALRLWVEEELKALQADSGWPPANALSTAFQMALLEILAAGLPSQVDEESMTGALMGAIAATVPWCAAAYADQSSPGCAWIRYRKSGATDSEPVTGADFALIIRLPGGTARGAVFQAKRIKSKNTMDIHHLSPELPKTPSRPKRKAEAQFLRIRDYAKDVLTACRRRTPKFSDLSWVHYLAYRSDRISCYSLDGLDDIDAHYSKKPTRSPGPIALSQRDSEELLWMLTMGASVAPGIDCQGWLTLKNEAETKAFAQIMIHLVDVFEGFAHPDVGYEPTIERGFAKKHSIGIAQRKNRLVGIKEALVLTRPQLRKQIQHAEKDLRNSSTERRQKADTRTAGVERKTQEITSRSMERQNPSGATKGVRKEIIIKEEAEIKGKKTRLRNR